MRTHKKYAVKVVVFCLLLAIILNGLNRLLMVQQYYNSYWPETASYEQFYQMEKNSVDVLFLGSSHCMTSFSPLQLYDEYGITSYNLSSEEQGTLVSYFWLREALKYQSPQVVVLDTYTLFTINQEEVLNARESTVRLAIDPMRWSGNKLEAVRTICEVDDAQSEISYLMTNIRYHERWSELTENDFKQSSLRSHESLMGFSALTDSCDFQEFTPIDPENEESIAEPVALMQEYLDKIVELCEDRGIRLILTKTPSTTQTASKYNYVSGYAESKGIEFIDFNTEPIYAEAGYDFAMDNCDSGGHLNLWGAEKVTSYIGRVLTEQYGIVAKDDAQWESLQAYYETTLQDCELTRVTDIYRYLELLHNDRYTIFMAVKDEGTNALDDELIELLMELGLTTNLKNAPRCSYYAIIEGDQVEEAVGTEQLEHEGSFRNGAEMYSITSAGFDAGDTCSIIIAGDEYAKKKRGLNIVVYSNDLKRVIDSVCFDTYEGLAATR
ncbi:MAG: hypothetical protein LIO67_06775 [Lachnospiraceae bacterium]|nr:hypothetical protein [Lachnospiraceae bacterium]